MQFALLAIEGRIGSMKRLTRREIKTILDEYHALAAFHKDRVDGAAMMKLGVSR